MSLGQAGFVLIQSITGNHFLDLAMVFSAEYLVLMVPLILVYLWFQGQEGRRTSVLGFLAVVTGIVSTYLLGLFYFHKPPQFHGFETILTKSMENAFPSQHTAAAFSLVWPLLYREQRRLGGAMFAAAALTGFGRVYTGLHFPVDILGGVAASLIGFGAVYALEDKIYRVITAIEHLYRRYFTDPEE